MSEAEIKDPQPAFDFSDYSYADAQNEFDLRLKRQRIAQKLDLGAFTSQEDFDALMADYRALDLQIDAELCRNLVSVPREWLVSKAPDKIDWHKPESLRWVRADRMGWLRKAGREASSPESVSGNSVKR